jgi:hypothetical protein
MGKKGAPLIHHASSGGEGAKANSKKTTLVFLLILVPQYFIK